MVIRLVLAALIVAACSDDAVVVVPVIDGPTNDLASGFPVDTIELVVTHAGDDASEPIASATFTKGQPIVLAGVPFADDLVIHMTGKLGNVESYGRTCPFAVAPDTRTASPHLYFAQSGSLGQLPFSPAPRAGGQAVTYHDGTGLLAGGTDPNDPSSPVSTVERYDPRAATFDVLATVSERLNGVSALYGLGDGARLAVLGGTERDGATPSPVVDLVEADSPADRRVTQISGAQAVGRVGVTATTLADGQVLVAGGPPYADPDTGNTTDLFVVSDEAGPDQPPSPAVGRLMFPRSFHTATLLGDQLGAPVLLAGGIDPATGALVAQAEIYKPADETVASGFDPAMVAPRHHHQAIRLPDNSVLILGGVDASNNPVTAIERFTLDGGFQPVPGVALDAAAPHVDMTVNLLPVAPDGSVRVLITGGRVQLGGPALDTIYRIDIPATGAIAKPVVLSVRLSVPRAGHQATLLCNGMLMISGGTPDPSPIEIYDPGSVGQR